MNKIPIESVDDSGRYREDFQDIDTLIESIRQHGLVQAITVVNQHDGTYRLVAGGRRVRACRELGMPDIPALVIDSEIPEDKLRSMELIENIHRADFTPVEEALLKAQIHEMKIAEFKEKGMKWRQEDTAHLLGDSTSGISRDLIIARALEDPRTPEELAERILCCSTKHEARLLIDKEQEKRLIGELARRKEQKLMQAVEQVAPKDPGPRDLMDEPTVLEEDILEQRLAKVSEEVETSEVTTVEEAMHDVEQHEGFINNVAPDERPRALGSKAKIGTLDNRPYAYRSKKTLLQAYQVGDFLESDPQKDLFDVHKSKQGFQLAEVDPPYAENMTDKKIHGSAAWNQLHMDEYTEITEGDYPNFVRAVAQKVYDCLNPDAWCLWWFSFKYYQLVYDTLVEVGFKLPVTPLFWYKYRGVTKNPETTLASTVEQCFYARKGSPVLAGPGRGKPNLILCEPVPAPHKRHPMMRPPKMIYQLLRRFEPHGVLVPFAGSGVTLSVAHIMYGGNPIGYDLSEHYRDKFIVDVANDKL